MKAILSVLLLPLLAVSAAAETPAITPLPPATLAELAANPQQESSRPPARDHDRPHSLFSFAAMVGGPAPLASVITPRLERMATPAPANGFFAAADPPFAYPADASGAAGPRHVLAIFNTSVTVHDRTGRQLADVPIDSFWFDAAHVGEFHYDTRAAYDAANDRWTLITLGDTNLAHGYLLVATAKGDPTGIWHRFRVALGGAKADGDFTRLALTSASVIVTLRLYDGDLFSGCDVYEFAKSDLYVDGSVIPAALHFHVSTDDLTPIATTDPSDNRTRFVSGKNADLSEYDGANFVSSTSYIAPMDFDTPRQTAGAQLGTPQLMDTGEMIFHYAVVRNGVTWIVRSVEPRSGATAHTSILLWRIDPTGPARTYLIDDPVGNASYAFPSLAVNKYGAVLVAYSYFSPDVYPSAAATYIDPAGSVVGTSFLKKGVAPYLIDRWGDYTTTVVDPADDTNFWSLALYRGSTVPSVQQWAAWWSYITVGPHKPHAVRR